MTTTHKTTQTIVNAIMTATVFTMLAFVFSTQASADGASATRALESGDYATAFREFTQLSNQGNPKAQYYLGIMYNAGMGCPKDTAKGSALFQKSANGGYQEAQNALGTCYLTGECAGISRGSVAEAIKWYTTAADQNDCYAMSNLGGLYNLGQGVPVDKAKAFKWYKKSVDSGCTTDLQNLAAMYEKGEGVQKDKAESDRLNKKLEEFIQGSHGYEVRDNW